jgi:sRNA-binding protein
MAQDVNAAFRAVVAHEVARALAPYCGALDALSRLAGSGPPRRGPGRPPGSVSKSRRGRANVGDASKFSAGQAVRYKQGRGEFAAKVVSIDTTKHRVTISREKDGKKVTRPADKVYA